MSPLSFHRPMLAAVVALVACCQWAAAQETPKAGQGEVAPIFAEHSRAPLDLSIDVMYVLTPEQVGDALGGPDIDLTNAQTPLSEQSEQIEVRATREQHSEELRTPIPFGFASIVWAFYNPSEAWRLFAPIESGQQIG
jgi:hypothetical protein